MWSCDDLFLFIKVAEIGNFSHSAKSLGIGQSTISNRIQKLESDLNTTLLRRSTKSIELTDIGRKLYDQLKGNEAAIKKIVNETLSLKEVAGGTLRIVLPPVFSQSHIMPKLMEFMALYPEIKLHLFFENKINELIKHGIDYAIMSQIPEQQNLKVKFLCESHFIMFCTPEYATRHGVPMTLEELGQHNIVSPINEFIVLQQLPVTNLKTGETTIIKLSDSLACNNSNIVKDVVYSNEIISGGFFFMVSEEIKAGKLIQVLPEYSFASVKYYQVRHPNEESVKVQVFAKFIEECILAQNMLYSR